MLYKYLPPERKSYLKDGLLRFTQPADLNDPFELLPTMSMQQFKTVRENIMLRRLEGISIAVRGRNDRRLKNKLIKKLSVESARQAAHDYKGFQEFFFESARDRINSTIGILSLSRRWDSSLMWSHYTNSHAGFCVGFRREHEFFETMGKASDPEKGLHKVEYSTSRVPVSHVEGQSIDIKVLWTKSEDWRYEHEERVVALLKDADKRIPCAPYDVCLFSLPHEMISELTLGLRAHVDLIEEAKLLGEALKVPVYKAALSEGSFDMIRRELA